MLDEQSDNIGFFCLCVCDEAMIDCFSLVLLGYLDVCELNFFHLNWNFSDIHFFFVLISMQKKKSFAKIQIQTVMMQIYFHWVKPCWPQSPKILSNTAIWIQVNKPPKQTNKHCMLSTEVDSIVLLATELRENSSLFQKSVGAAI